jgi:hypothetical protein
LTSSLYDVWFPPRAAELKAFSNLSPKVTAKDFQSTSTVTYSHVRVISCIPSFLFEVRGTTIEFKNFHFQDVKFFLTSHCSCFTG